MEPSSIQSFAPTSKPTTVATTTTSTVIPINIVTPAPSIVVTPSPVIVADPGAVIVSAQKTTNEDNDHIVIGGLVGAVIFLALCLCLVFTVLCIWWCRKRHKDDESIQQGVTIVVEDSEMVAMGSEGTSTTQMTGQNTGHVTTSPKRAKTPDVVTKAFSSQKGDMVLLNESDSDGDVIFDDLYDEPNGTKGLLDDEDEDVVPRSMNPDIEGLDLM